MSWWWIAFQYEHKTEEMVGVKREEFKLDNEVVKERCKKGQWGEYNK